MGLTLFKYEALGNDFLVDVDPEAARAFPAELVRALCDRRRGVGADGLLRISRDGDGMAMELHNADGGLAETSGNGIRCAVLAARDAGIVTTPGPVSVRTLAGRVEVELCERAPGEPAWLRSGMGICRPTAEEFSPAAGHTAVAVDVGNPHLVLLARDGAPAVDLDELGPRLEAARPGGVNVEVVRVAGPGRLELVVWERGAGRTLACGSGSCAAATAARLLGLVGEEVVVDNPGGRLLVRLSGPPDAAWAELEGPARRVAVVEPDEEFLSALAHPAETAAAGTT